MASFWSRGGGGGDEVEDDFDEYDPTPYGGGYDLSLTFGRPLPPSEETCYPVSPSSSGFDYERPSYSSGSKTSAYEADYHSEDRYGHSQSRPQAAYGFRPKQEESSEEQVGGFEGGGGRHPQPRPAYGVGPNYGGQSDYGSEQGYGSVQGYGSGQASYGSVQGYRSEHGGRPKRGEDEGGSYGSKFGVGSDREEGGHIYGGDDYRTKKYGYGGRPTYGGEEDTGRDQRPGYYNPNQAEGYDRPSHGGESDDEEKKHHHHEHHYRRNYDDE